MESRVPVRAGVVALALAAVAFSCSQPEAFHAGRGGLATGMAGAGGAAGAMAGAGGPAGAGVAGDTGGPAGSGVAGDTGSGVAGMGAAGMGDAGMGAAGSGPAGTGPAGTGPGGMGAAGSGPAGMGAAGMGAAGMGAAGMGAAGMGAAGAPPPSAAALPMTVSDHFRPTGGMGDGAVVGSVTFGTDAAACAGEPAAANVGTCYAVTYNPQPIAAGAPSTWAGFYWQYPDNNWGTSDPQLVASGAKAITFYAKGVAGGEKITFKAGGINGTPFSDAFSIENTFTLTTGWKQYSLPMTNLTYGGGVLGGFCWVATATNATPIKFVLHGIVWEK
jgi:hypothetical protein